MQSNDALFSQVYGQAAIAFPCVPQIIIVGGLILCATKPLQRGRLKTIGACCYYATEIADFILILSVRDMANFESFICRHFFVEDNVLRFRTSAVIERVKASLAVRVVAD